jgi:hypothetical protein
MFTSFWHRLKAYWRFRGYQPQKVTLPTIERWLQQFPPQDRSLLLELLMCTKFVSEEEARQLLVERNNALLKRLASVGIPRENVIYMQFDDAGSSSSLMLALLKESALLERSGCHFLDSRDIKEVTEKTRKLGSGAIIYVDDFIGTGTQFCRSRDYTAQYFQGTFSEFLLSVCVCEEAIYKLGERGVEASAGFLHSLSERALHDYSNILSPEKKQRLLALGQRIDKKWSLGYKNMGSMVVIYRNAPNTLPLLLRGNVGQNPYVGVVPRTTDLPVPYP